MNTTTNANNTVLAAHLASTKKGASFTGIILKKKGQERGKGADKKVYGNDTVHVCVVTGFSYLNLCKRSLDKLGTIDLDQLVLEAAAKGCTDKNGVALTRDDFDLAMAEVAESLAKSIDGTNVSTTDHVFEPLVVDGKTVVGVRVYNGPAPTDENDRQAPVPGTCYIQGLQIGSRVIASAPNGPVPPAASAAKTIAKGMIEALLPKSRYVSYCLSPESGFILKVGGAAVEALTANAVEVSFESDMFA